MATMPFGSSHTMESLKYIDLQLANLDLNEEENNLVRAHRLQSLELRQKRMSQLGPMPSTHPEIWNWEKQKAEAEAEIKLSLEQTLLSVPGLEAAWSKHLELDKMKKMRAEIISSVTNALQAPSGQEAPATSAPASSGEPGPAHCLMVRLGAYLYAEKREPKVCPCCADLLEHSLVPHQFTTGRQEGL